MCKICGCFRFGKPDKEILLVEGMVCGNCKEAVETAVRGLAGVLSAEVDLEAKNVTVEFDHHKSTKAEIINTIEDIGFDVKS